MRISDWSSDVCSSDLDGKAGPRPRTADRISCQGNHGGLTVSGTRPLNGVMTHASFPAIRMRRTRAAAWSRAMFAENRIGPQDLIWPLFVTEGKEVEEPVSSLPGVSRWSVDLIVARAREARDAGIPCLALFPNTPPEKRSADGKEALNPDNLMCRATKAIKDAVPDIGILTDVALDPYTSHGQDGLIDAEGYVLNDATTEVLTGQALAQAAAGADIIAPRDLMDGRIGIIRSALEDAGHINVQIMSYAAKYASAFYGPLRDAVGSRGRMKRIGREWCRESGGQS